ncbi:fluoride efflux transporter CrcB [Desulfatitalea alkaliphila]|uniref:Fluoride-specific ion channel FluC n=1 Tax=Desulfatitalea alkaliphila TaxID=2929485 RepID=A0AA41UK74_9BACT|nr:fluoride efflux transporter CrcB [Desulfatitalea alkaliphila]MCJ8502740.1 fluoride efflux transporter CrcB [Desulfatitalea alkaliphila]
MTFKTLVLIMCGGGLGAVGRYGVGLLTMRFWGHLFPWGTMLVNLAGCFLAGLLYGLAERARWITPELRLLLITGFLGAFTTFSAFALETVNTARAGLLQQSLTNILINTLGGIALAFLGLWLARLQ